jgi:sec-independent protein translocase protein TatA
MGNLGTTEILLILLVVLIFFGAKKIPELAQGLGKGIREFKKATREIENEVTNEVKKVDEKPADTAKKE